MFKKKLKKNYQDNLWWVGKVTLGSLVAKVPPEHENVTLINQTMHLL